MKLKRFLCGFVATLILGVSECLPTFATEVPVNENNTQDVATEMGELKFMPLASSTIVINPDSPNASRVPLGSNSSGNFTYSGSVTVTIPSGITSYSANQVGIIIVDRTNSSHTGDKFSVECTNRPLHNTQTYTTGSTSWRYYNLVGLNLSGGSSATFKATWTSGNNFTDQFEIIAGLFYYG